MLKKRSRSIQKDQQMGQITSDGSESFLQSAVLVQKQKTSSFFTVPGLFVGLTPRTASDCDSIRSPTSPLDFKLFCNLGGCFRYPKSSQEGNHKCWECQKVGLGSIVDSAHEDDRRLPEKDNVIPLSNSSSTILFGSQIRSKGALNLPNHADYCEAPKSVPKNYAIFPQPRLEPSNLQKGSSGVLFEIGGDPLESDPFGKPQSFSLDSKRLSTRYAESRFENKSLSLSLVGENKLAPPSQMPVPSADGIARSLTPEEIESSEDYTCVISRGPNPKITHIFGDCVLECHSSGVDLGNKSENLETCNSSKSALSPFPSDDFLSYCYFCKKKLEQGKDIYMYRGEKAFCSWDCRLEEISIEEEQENSITEARGDSPKSENGDDIFEKSMFVAI